MEEYHQFKKDIDLQIDDADKGVGFINFKEPEQNSKPTVDKLINILQNYKESEKEIDSIEDIFLLFIVSRPNGELLIRFIEQLKYNYPECQLRDINFMNVYETLNQINS